MPQPFLEFEQVSKSFGRQEALSAVSFEVGRGEIVGFVGPNGAGKSTAMRILVGLLRPDRGAVRLAGLDQRAHPRRVRAQIGALIESPASYPGLTASDHLAYVGRLRGLRAVDPAQALRSVGLDPTSRKPVRQFSLGMKQRLGLAMATLGAPSLLVLDEPMNGLDPLGMADLRDYLRRLPSRTGAGVLVSSHLLAEIEQVCDRVLLIRDGRLLAGTDMRGNAAERRTVLLRTSDDARAEEVLRKAAVAESLELGPGGILCRLHAGAVGRLATVLVGEGLEVHELTPRGLTLEDIYVATYGDEHNGRDLR